MNWTGIFAVSGPLTARSTCTVPRLMPRPIPEIPLLKHVILIVVQLLVVIGLFQNQGVIPEGAIGINKGQVVARISVRAT